MSRLLEWFRHKGNGWALLIGIAVFTAGFGTLNVFWAFGDWRHDVPGLWDYRSATIGDGLLLPLAAGILAAVGNRLHPASHERRTMRVAGALGLLGGFLLQLAWLADPNPRLNWTFPAPHTFNAPGICHAIFLTLASGLFAALAARLASRVFSSGTQLIRGGTESIERSAETIGAFLAGCLLGFVGLLILDSLWLRGQAPDMTMANASTFIAIAVALAMGSLIVAVTVRSGLTALI